MTSECKTVTSFSVPLTSLAFFVAGCFVALQSAMVPLYVIVDTLARGLAARHHPREHLVPPVAVLILTGFMRSLPKDLLTRPLSTAPPEVTQWRIVLPSPARPRHGGDPFFVITWNDLLFPLLFLKTDVNKTLPPALLNSGAST